MQKEPQTIFIMTEFIFPDEQEFRIPKDKVRELYNKMHEPGGYPYDSLDVQGTKLTLSTQRDGGGKSKCEFSADRMRIEEHKPIGDLGEFIDIVKTIVGAIELPPCLVHRCKVGMIGQPSHHDSSLELLADGVANVLLKIGPFERPPSLFGVRFRFFPYHPDDAMEDDKGEDNEGEDDADESEEKSGDSVFGKPAASFIDLKFETWQEDITKVFLEASSSYPGVFALSKETDAIVDNITETFQFISKKCWQFLDQFDKPNGDKRLGEK